VTAGRGEEQLARSGLRCVIAGGARHHLQAKPHVPGAAGPRHAPLSADRAFWWCKWPAMTTLDALRRMIACEGLWSYGISRAVRQGRAGLICWAARSDAGRYSRASPSAPISNPREAGGTTERAAYDWPYSAAVVCVCDRDRTAAHEQFL